MARKTRTNFESINISKHLEYEYFMLGLLLIEIPKHEKATLLSNATVECFAVHSRTLIDFFWGDLFSSRDDDVLAVDFIDDDKDWISKRPELSLLLKDARTMANKRVVHLTYTRLDYDISKDKWNTGKIHQELFYSLSCFLKIANHSKLGQGCSKLLEFINNTR